MGWVHNARLQRLLHSPWSLVVLFGLGAFVRILWCIVRDAQGGAGEAVNVATSIATSGVFGNPFGPDQGPTAHLMPTTPLLAGLVYKLLGVKSLASEFVLGAWALFLVLGSFALLFEAFRRFGTPRVARLAALGVLCVAPVYTGQEIVDFRAWEGGLAVFLAALFLLLLLRFEQRGHVSTRAVLAMSLLAAILFFVSPALGLGAYAAGLWFMLANLPPGRIAGTMLAAAAALALIVTPWTIRNIVVMREPILLRDNLGLELALANHPAAAGPGDPKSIFLARLYDIHPHVSPDAYARLKSMGEVQYARALGEGAKQWIAENPGKFAKLSLTRLTQLYLPRPWQFHVFGTPKFPAIRSAIACAVGALGLLGVLWALLAADRRRGYAALLVIMPGLTYMAFQPVLRYSYLVYALLAFFAADFLVRAYRSVKHRRASRQSARVTAGWEETALAS